MKVSYPITLDVKKTNVQKVIHANQGEGYDRELCFTLVSGNETLHITGENTIYIKGKKEDQTIINNPCTIKDGKAYYYLTPQNLAVVGDVDCQLVVVSDGVTYSAKFTISVEEGIVTDDEIESADEFGLLIQLIQTVGKGKVYTGATNPSSDPEEYELIKANDVYIQYTSDYLIIYEATSVSTTVTWTERVKAYTKVKVESLLVEALEGSTSDSITYSNSEAADMILTGNCSKLVIDSFESTQNIMTFGFIPGIGQTLQDFIEIPTDELPYTIDVSEYDFIKFRTYSYDNLGNSTVEYSLKNVVVREKELFDELSLKQDIMSAGDGIEIINNLIKAKIQGGSDDALSLGPGGLKVSKAALGYSGDFRGLLISGTVPTNRIASRAYVEEVALGLGNTLAVSIDSQTYVMTLTLKHGNEVLSTGSVDLPLETMVVDADYDSQTKEIVLTLQSGSTVRFSVADLVSGLVSTEELEEILADYLTEDEITALLADKQDELTPSDTVHIDPNGVITATEPKYELIKTIDISQLSEPVSMFVIDQDEQGNAFAYDDVYVEIVGTKASAANSKIAIDSYTSASSNPITTFSKANALNTSNKSILYDISRKTESSFYGALGGTYNNEVKYERKNPNLTYSHKINKVQVYTDTTFTEGILKVYGRRKY